jgi:ABC-type transporter Mla subunit MlaD
MNLEMLAIVLCILAALGLGFLIPVLIQLKRTIKEAEETLRSVRGITDKVNEVTDNVTSISGGLSGAAHDLRVATKHMEKLAVRLSRHFSGLKAAMSAAAGVLINNLRGDRK